jgi:hypothetical protein
MALKNMITRQFLILSMIIIDGSIASTIIFSNVDESLKFIGLIMMCMISAFIVMTGTLYVVR